MEDVGRRGEEERRRREAGRVGKRRKLGNKRKDEEK